MLDRSLSLSTEPFFQFLDGLRARFRRLRLRLSLAAAAALSLASLAVSAEADELDAWRSAFLRGWLTINDDGRIGLPVARSPITLESAVAAAPSAIEAGPSSRRKIRLTAGVAAEPAPLRLIPRDVQAVYLESADPSLVWEPHRPPYPKIVRSRHEEPTEPSRAHDPAKVRATVRAIPSPKRDDRADHAPLADEPAVEVESLRVVEPRREGPKDDAASTILDLMEKMGSALRGTEFGRDRPFGFDDAAAEDAEEQRRMMMQNLREWEREAVDRETAEPGLKIDLDFCYGPPRGERSRVAEETRATSAECRPDATETAHTSDRPTPDAEELPAEPKRFELHGVPAPAHAMPEGVVDPQAAADALWVAAAQLEHAANVLEKESLYERADQLRDQAHRLRVDARSIKHPRMAVRPAAERREENPPKTSSVAPTPRPAAGVEPMFLRTSCLMDDVAPIASAEPGENRRGALTTLVDTLERMGRLLEGTAFAGVRLTTLTASECVDAEEERRALFEQFRRWETATRPTRRDPEDVRVFELPPVVAPAASGPQR